MYLFQNYCKIDTTNIPTNFILTHKLNVLLITLLGLWYE